MARLKTAQESLSGTRFVSSSCRLFSVQGQLMKSANEICVWNLIMPALAKNAIKIAARHSPWGVVKLALQQILRYPERTRTVADTSTRMAAPPRRLGSDAPHRHVVCPAHSSHHCVGGGLLGASVRGQSGRGQASGCNKSGVSTNATQFRIIRHPNIPLHEPPSICTFLHRPLYSSQHVANTVDVQRIAK